LEAYADRCAISDCDCADALEAAHIHPYRGEKTNHPTNGLLLRSDLHVLFDLGKICVDVNSYTIIVSLDLMATVYGRLQGKKLHLPIEPAKRPSAQLLNHHRSKAGL
jgi:predicted restriction endonuclease